VTATAASPTADAPPADPWREYWSRDALWRDSPLGDASARILLRRVGRVLSFDPADAVLEIGCGPGHLAALLAPRVRRVHAVDVAAPAVTACRERCRGRENVTVAQLGSDSTDLAGCGGPFTRIVCASVVQYYRDMEDVVRLIRAAQAVAAPGAALLIVDLPLARGPAGFAWDALGTFAGALRGGYAGPLLRAARGRWCAGSAYRACEERAGSLAFTRAAIDDLVARTGLRATVLRRSLSVYANRPSLLFAL
jgi:SAM-dependent methyltransferase